MNPDSGQEASGAEVRAKQAVIVQVDGAARLRYVDWDARAQAVIERCRVGAAGPDAGLRCTVCGSRMPPREAVALVATGECLCTDCVVRLEGPGSFRIRDPP